MVTNLTIITLKNIVTKDYGYALESWNEKHIVNGHKSSQHEILNFKILRGIVERKKSERHVNCVSNMN